MHNLSYLSAYPPHLVNAIEKMIAENTLESWLKKRYPHKHNIQTDKSLYDYVMVLKQQHFRNTKPISKVLYDNKMNLIKGTLGTNTFNSRVQGQNLKSKNEIRIAAFLREAPEEFLKMIVIHELAHLKEKDHNKAFYQLCCHALPDYHQLEFDLRVWLVMKC